MPRAEKDFFHFPIANFARHIILQHKLTRIVALFSAKTKNRRFQRKHVLRVKLRASQRWKLRLRRGVFVLGLPFFVLAGAYGAWRGAEVLLREYVYENPAFAIHQIDVQTDGAIDPEQIRRWAGVKLQENLLALDLPRVQRDLEAIPNIQAAAIERVLPHTLKIRIVEREAVAQLAIPQPSPTNVFEKVIFLVGADGTVMLPLEPAQRSSPNVSLEPLPGLLGVPNTVLRPGRRIESPQALAALKLIELFERSSMAGLVEIRNIDITIPHLLQVFTAQNSDVTFGMNDLEGQLRRWRAVHDFAMKAGRYVAWMDLSVANNVPARWLDPNLPVPSAPKPTKAVRTKKRHV